MKKVKKYIPFSGPCPLLSCTETSMHFHPVCPVCGAINYGNITCPECREYHRIKLEAEKCN
jgi:hypothetical protein